MKRAIWLLAAVVALTMAISPPLQAAENKVEGGYGPKVRKARKNRDKKRLQERKRIERRKRAKQKAQKGQKNIRKRRQMAAKRKLPRPIVIQFEHLPVESFMNTLEQLSKNPHLRFLQKVPVVINEHVNAIVIVAPPELTRLVAEIAKGLDKPNPMARRRKEMRRRHDGPRRHGPRYMKERREMIRKRKMMRKRKMRDDDRKVDRKREMRRERERDRKREKSRRRSRRERSDRDRD